MDAWAEGAEYDDFMGRWSRPVARDFLTWLQVPEGRRWLDVGCGTGALTAAIADASKPADIAGIDPSEGFLAVARARLGPAADFGVGDAQALPFDDGRFDAVVSGLALNFVPDPMRAVGEMRRVAAPGSTVAAYVWDYADGMQMIRTFWDVALALDPSVTHLDEANRFPLCRAGPLRDLFNSSGLRAVDVASVEAPTTFTDFEDFWNPLMGGQGPAPGYLATLTEEARVRFAEVLRAALPVGPDGIHLTARAWAVRGTA